MSQDFLDKPGWLKRYLRKYNAGEIDERWREYIGNSTAIKLRFRGVPWSMFGSLTEENSLKLSLALGFISAAGDVAYRAIDEVQILGVSEIERTIFVSVINTVVVEPAILIIQFHDVNLWDAGFLIEKSKELPNKWCNLVNQVVTPVTNLSAFSFSLQELFESLNILADALYRKLRVREEEAAAIMTKTSGEGTSKSRKKPSREKMKSGNQGASEEEPHSSAHLAKQGEEYTPTRRGTPRSARVIDLTTTPTNAESPTNAREGSEGVEIRRTSIARVKQKSTMLASTESGHEAHTRLLPTVGTTAALSTAREETFLPGRGRSGISFAVPGRRSSSTPTTTFPRSAEIAVNAGAASTKRGTNSASRSEGQTPVETFHNSGRVRGMKKKTKKRLGVETTTTEARDSVDASADGEGVAANDFGGDSRRSGSAAAAGDDIATAASLPLVPLQMTDTNPHAEEPLLSRDISVRLSSKRLPVVRQRYDGTWTSYPAARMYDPAKEKANINCAVYKKPPSKADKDEKSYMDLRMAHNMEFKAKVEYMYLFGYEQHFQLPLDRMRPVKQETEGLMVYRKLEKDGIDIVYQKMLSLDYQKQVFTVMPDMKRRPRSWGEICDDVQFIIINGQHTWAAAKEVLGRGTVPDLQLVQMMRFWECKVVWTTNHDHLHSLSYLCNDSSSGDAICSSTPSAIIHCRALWEEAGKPMQVRKNAARGGKKDEDEVTRMKWESFKDNAMQALIATLNPSVRRKFFDFDSRGERYLMMTSEDVWKKWESIFKLHRLGDLKDVVTGKPLRHVPEWDYKPLGSSVREVSGLTDGEIGELATRILESPAKVYLQPPPKDSNKRAKVHRAQSMKEWCVRKKQKKVILREVQRRVNHVRGDHSYFPLDFNVYNIVTNAVEYGDWDFVKSKHGLTSHHMDYLLRSAGSAFFVEQHKRPTSIVEQPHVFTKAIDQVLVTRQRALHLESVPGFVIEYLHGEKRYSDVMMEYSRIANRRISTAPSYKRSNALISGITVGCIIMDCRNFPYHPNEQIDHLTERTLLAGLDIMGDADMTNLQPLLCITTKHRAEILKRMLERNWDNDVAFKVMEYEPVGGEQRPLSKGAEHEIAIVLMTIGASRAGGEFNDGDFQVKLQHSGVEPSDYKQAQYRIEHRHCEFVAELRMELYLRFIDRFCEADRAVLLMHAGTKAIRASRMLGRVCVSLHDLHSSPAQVIFGKAFMEGLTMIPKAFFYSSPSPLKTKMRKFHLKTAFGEKVAVGWDPPSEQESEESLQSGDTSSRTSSLIPLEVNTGDGSEELQQQLSSDGEGSKDNLPEPHVLASEGSRENDVPNSGGDEEDEGDSEGNGEQSAGSTGDEEDEDGAEADSSDDDKDEAEADASDDDEDEEGAEADAIGDDLIEKCIDLSETTESEDSSDRLPRISAQQPILSVVPVATLHECRAESEAMLHGEGAPDETVDGVLARASHNVCDGVLAEVENAIAPAVDISNLDCVPATPEPQAVALDGKAAKDAFLLNLLEQGSPTDHSINVDAVMRQQQRNAAMERELTSRRESSFIDLDNVDDKEMEESMAELAALAQELRGGVVVKQERADPLLPTSGDVAGATKPFLDGCSQMSGTEIAVDVKPNVADVWRTTMAEGSSARKRKREFDALVANQARLLEIVQKGAKQQEELMKSLLQSQSEIAYLRKFAPSAGPNDSFRPDQQSQLFSAISSGASPVQVGGRSTAPLTQMLPASEATDGNLVHSVAIGDQIPSTEREVEIVADVATRGVSVVSPDMDGHRASAGTPSATPP